MTPDYTHEKKGYCFISWENTLFINLSQNGSIINLLIGNLWNF